MRVFYLCLVLGLGPGVGRGVLTWLMSSMLARGAREVLALLAIITDRNVLQDVAQTHNVLPGAVFDLLGQLDRDLLPWLRVLDLEDTSVFDSGIHSSLHVSGPSHVNRLGGFTVQRYIANRTVESLLRRRRLRLPLDLLGFFKTHIDKLGGINFLDLEEKKFH